MKQLNIEHSCIKYLNIEHSCINMIVYLARDITAFVMYCVNGASRSSLLIESPDSMIERRVHRAAGNTRFAHFCSNPQMPKMVVVGG